MATAASAAEEIGFISLAPASFEDRQFRAGIARFRGRENLPDEAPKPASKFQADAGRAAS
jgi:hypothetical protein